MSSWSRLQEHAVILPWILVLVVVAVVAIGVATAPHPLPAECDQNLPAAHALLPCDTAVRLSVAALAIDHAPVNRVQFGYGSARPWECGLPVAIPRVCSYVVFTFADGSRQYVAVQWQQDRFLVATRDDVVAYDRVHAEILQIADMLSDGIIAQFPSHFAG